jgi:hypothetical protein
MFIDFTYFVENQTPCLFAFLAGLFLPLLIWLSYYWLRLLLKGSCLIYGLIFGTEPEQRHIINQGAGNGGITSFSCMTALARESTYLFEGLEARIMQNGFGTVRDRPYINMLRDNMRDVRNYGRPPPNFGLFWQKVRELKTKYQTDVITEHTPLTVQEVLDLVMMLTRE